LSAVKKSNALGGASDVEPRASSSALPAPIMCDTAGSDPAELGDGLEEEGDKNGLKGDMAGVGRKLA
jgi:hypothetical protein